MNANSSPVDLEQHPDDVAVDRFCVAMKEKLARKRAQGRGGWEDPNLCSQEFLSDLLHEHVRKPDPLDVAIISMMLHQRGETILPSSIFDASKLLPGDVDPHTDSERTMRVVHHAYDWTLDPDGRLIGLVAGDMGYESTHIVLSAETIAALVESVIESALGQDASVQSDIIDRAAKRLYETWENYPVASDRSWEVYCDKLPAGAAQFRRKARETLLGAIKAQK